MIVRFDGWDLVFDEIREEYYWFYNTSKLSYHLREIGTLKLMPFCELENLEHAFVDGDVVQHKGTLYVAEVTRYGEVLIGTECYRMSRAEDIKLIKNNTKVVQR